MGVNSSQNIGVFALVWPQGTTRDLACYLYHHKICYFQNRPPRVEPLYDQRAIRRKFFRVILYRRSETGPKSKRCEEKNKMYTSSHQDILEVVFETTEGSVSTYCRIPNPGHIVMYIETRT